MPEKKFMISPEKRIFSRVEQECEPGMQAWNGSVPEAGQRRSASVGRGTNQERARQGRGDKGEAQGAEGGRSQGNARERRGRKRQGEETGGGERGAAGESSCRRRA